MKLLLVFSVLIAATLAHPLEDVASFPLQNRIAGGVVATPNQFPYQVGLMMRKFKEGKLVYTWCGGSLISDQVVLTAGHCFYRALSAVVILGAHNRFNSSEPGRIVIKVNPDNLVIHERYDPFITENDIAFATLPKKVTLTGKIQTINLPRRSQKSENFEGITGIISGWGRRGDQVADKQTYTLRYVSRKVLSNENCSHVYRHFMGNSQICVDGSDKKSACSGDSGGPLTIEEADGSKTLIGLTSYGRREGCQKNFPISYTRVTAYLDWIAEKTGIELRE